MSSALHISLSATLPERYNRMNAAAAPNAPESMSYYAEVLLSLSRGVVHPRTNVKRNFLGEHIDPTLLSNTSFTSFTGPHPRDQSHQLAVASKSEALHPREPCTRPSTSLVRTSRPKISLTECARRMERSSRAIARHAATISDTLRELDNNKIHKRARTTTTTDTTDQKSSERPTKAQPTYIPRSRKLKTKSNEKLKKDSPLTPNPSGPPLKQKLRLCLANQIKYCSFIPDHQDSKENLVHGSLLGASQARQIGLVKRKSS